MGLLQPATGGSYLKAAIQGFRKAGKTHTGAELAMGVREFFGLSGPITMFDTEKGSESWKARIKERTGQDLLVARSRSLPDLLAAGREALARGASVYLVDSLTHVWREVVQSYVQQRMDLHRRQRRRVSDALEPEDWNRIKEAWAAWADWFLDAPIHIVACGRAGYEYDEEEDEDGRRQLVKSGVKLKAEGEFGHEPHLLVEMQRIVGEDGRPARRAIVVGDRYNVIDGATALNPTWEFFRPHLAQLSPDQHAPIVIQERTTFALDGEGRSEWQREKEQRQIAAEKVLAVFALADIGGQSAADKKARVEAMREYWGTESWTELSEKLPSARIREGLERFKDAYGLRTGGQGEDDVNHLRADAR